MRFNRWLLIIISNKKIGVKLRYHRFERCLEAPTSKASQWHSLEPDFQEAAQLSFMELGIKDHYLPWNYKLHSYVVLILVAPSSFYATATVFCCSRLRERNACHVKLQCALVAILHENCRAFFRSQPVMRIHWILAHSHADTSNILMRWNNRQTYFGFVTSTSWFDIMSAQNWRKFTLVRSVLLPFGMLNVVFKMLELLTCSCCLLPTLATYHFHWKIPTLLR